jgi:Na+/H+ antiporter NhaD/arsenite permease-like protein
LTPSIPLVYGVLPFLPFLIPLLVFMPGGHAITTLVIFIISIFFVIVPVRIPLPSRRFPTHIPINLTTAPIAAILILWAAQCLGPSVIRDGIVGTEGIKPYNILLLFMSLAYLSITLDITGVLQAAAFWVSNKGGSSGWKNFFYFYVMLTLLSVVIGNDPVILSGTVFLVYYTTATKLEPIPWLMAEFAAANTASMVLFVGNPTNVVICEGFGVNNVAFSAYTIFPFITCSIFCFVALAVQFHSPKHIPRQLEETKTRDPFSVLHDPVGAWVGSILLGSCLMVIIVVSFFGVDVWKISLPFAVAKFIFDMGWDYCRGRRNKLTRPPSPQHVDGNTSPAGVVTDVEKQNIPVPLPPRAPFTLSVTTFPPTIVSPTPATSSTPFILHSTYIDRLRTRFDNRFPTFSIALPRLPFALVPFAFSQFILIEALAHQGWIDIFAVWLIRATGREIYPTIWVVGVLGVFLCNISGTNIGATILLTKVVRAAEFPDHSLRAAAIALAVASNIGAVSFTFAASLAGLLWKGILDQRKIHIEQKMFAFWNLLPITVMTAVGLGVVCIEMAVIYP